jgi:antitoxin component HigA of HigAB toxin-antitoxin module
MSSLQQLQQLKADLELKIAQSLETAKKITQELEQAQIRQEKIDKGTAEIRAVMEKYDLSQDDLFPSASSKVVSIQNKESKTLAEMRQYFNRR